MSKVTGVKEMKRNIELLKKQHKARVFKGLVAGALLVKKESQKETPRRLGNLRSGAYIVTPKSAPDAGGGFTGKDSGKLASEHGDVMRRSQTATATRSTGGKATVAIGYTPVYALIVHENQNAGAAGYDPSKDRAGLKAERVHSRKGGWKFLEKALNKSHQHIKRAIAAAAKLPPGQVKA